MSPDPPRRPDRRRANGRPTPAARTTPVNKTRGPRTVGEFERRVLAALDTPSTSVQLARALGEKQRYVALALGTLRFNHLVTYDRVAGVNVWSAL